MWILNFIPDSILYMFVLSIIIAGVGVYLSSYIPKLGIPPVILRTIGVIVMVGGVYLYGGYGNEMSWRERAAALQAEIDRKNSESEKVTEKIVTEYVEKIKVVKEKGNVIVKEVPKYITKESDDKCTIPKSFIVLHNGASRNEVPDAAGGIDETASDVKLSRVLETTIGNYTIYYETAEQLKALQDWVRQQEKIYNGK
jgi:hypothetical protein